MLLAAESVSVSPIGPIMLEHEIRPLLEKGRRTEQEERIVKGEDVVCLQQILFMLHIDVKVGIDLVEIVEGHPVQLPNRLNQHTVDPRLLKGGVSEKDQDPTSNGHGNLQKGGSNLHI